jgi:hypothetical protein
MRVRQPSEVLHYCQTTNKNLCVEVAREAAAVAALDWKPFCTKGENYGGVTDQIVG